MDIRRLEAFAKVYELRSFSRAGQELFLSQPTISAHVSALEGELGVRLFDRLGRGILPTAAADILYAHAQEAFCALDVARAEIQLLQERVSGELAVGGSTIPAHYLLPGILARFLGKYPDISLHLTVGDTEEIGAKVSSGEILIGVVGGRTGHMDLAFEPVLEDDLVVIAAPGVVDHGPGPHPAKEIMNLPWVVREPGSGTRRAFDQSLTDQGLDPRRLKSVVSVESTQATLQFVAAGLGLGVTSRLAADRLLASGEVVEIAMQGVKLNRTFYLTYNERRHLFPVVRCFIDYLKGGAWREMLSSSMGKTGA